MAQEGLPIQVATRVLDVSNSGYYLLRSRGPSQREVRHALLTDVIGEVQVDSRGTYRYRRDGRRSGASVGRARRARRRHE